MRYKHSYRDGQVQVLWSKASHAVSNYQQRGKVNGDAGKLGCLLLQPKNFSPNWESSNIALALITIVRLLLWLTPFLSCVYGGDGSKEMPETLRISRNRLLLYWPLPLSQRNRVI